MKTTTEEKAVLCSALQFISSFASRAGEERENIEVGLQCFGQAFGIDVSQKDTIAEVDIPTHDLSEIFKAGLTSLQIEIGASNKASIDDGQDSVLQDPAVLENPEMWKKWMTKIESKGFFEGTEKGTKDYNDRVVRALEKFKQRFAPKDKYEGMSNEEREAKAEEVKGQGNAALSAQEYGNAVTLYTQALEYSAKGPKSHIYHANIAAALTHKGEFTTVLEHCEKAIDLMPTYVKSYSRMGYAHLQLGDFEAAVESYRRGLEVDPSNAACKEGLTEAESKQQVTAVPDAAPGPGAGMPDLSSLAGMLGGAGGGMDGLAGMMNNPQMQQMAQGMMQNPQMMQMAQNMMQNPEMLQNLMGSMGRGAGPPNKN